MFYKEMSLEISQNSQENTCACNFIKKASQALVFSYEFCEISKNTFFTEHAWTTASYLTNLVEYYSDHYEKVINSRWF